MNAKVSLILALCIYQAAAVTYPEAVAECKKQSSLENDAPIDHFFQKGSFPEGFNLGCFFNCVGKKMGALDSNGVPIKDLLDKIAAEHSTVGELQALASAYPKCSEAAKAKPAGCGATQHYAECAVINASTGA